MNVLDARTIANAANELIDARLHMGSAVQFTIPTGSMFPTLAPGDQVIVRRMCAQDLRLGDIVLIQAGGVWLAHRLIGRRVTESNIFFVTKGDNCVQHDPLWHAALRIDSSNGNPSSIPSASVISCNLPGLTPVIWMK